MPYSQSLRHICGTESKGHAMKVKQLIELLSSLDPELPVCVFSDMGAHLVLEPYLLDGLYEDPENVKLVFRETSGKFVALNNYADFDLEDRSYIHLD
jgi:hypothetical protein